ncbi:putative membrane protein [Pontibacter aydingkolensis]|uniref:DUF2254 domain-containing protein n=1 Tax=Pontibacter aydingkolensis TaxID=1911536 RepID=A0ABS7CV87_9BACT|nr:DUF2254 family protein [Pontibacter aydingkolensis]MBW7467783.1 DUF2254 domain-containing protein [Pontibacter aydingkolensis]
MKLSKLKYSVKKAYMQVTSSIAFYPTLIALGLLLLALLCTYLDKTSVGRSIISKVSFLMINNADTARSLLSSLLTGLISLFTFTFAMVMIVLTQVTSSFSPRLLPDLLRKRGSQVVLGVIVGTVCFTIVVLSNVQTMAAGPGVPLLSTVVNVLLGFGCVISFIYFIYKISNEVQIGNILNSTYRKTRDVLNRELQGGSYHEDWQEDGQFHLVEAWDSGYFDKITEREFRKASKKLGLKLRLLITQGEYLLKGDALLEINTPLNEKIKDILEENVLLRHQEMVKENFFYGFKHLTEIAVKALSPGVNDPGTAVQAVDYLMDLLCRLQQLRGQKVIQHDDGTACIIYAPVPFENTFYLCSASIRAYSSKDVTVQTRLINLISKISERDEQDRHRNLLERELQSIEEASGKEMISQEDVNYIKAVLEETKRQRMSNECSSTHRKDY